jgi:hypothetical protein
MLGARTYLNEGGPPLSVDGDCSWRLLLVVLFVITAGVGAIEVGVIFRHHGGPGLVSSDVDIRRPCMQPLSSTM